MSIGSLPQQEFDGQEYFCPFFNFDQSKRMERMLLNKWLAYYENLGIETRVEEASTKKRSQLWINREQHEKSLRRFDMKMGKGW